MLANERPELRQLWERQVGRHVGGFFNDPRRGSEGPSYKTLWRMAQVAGMEIQDFLFLAGGVDQQTIDNVEWATKLAFDTIKQLGRKPTSEDVAYLAQMFLEALRQRPIDRKRKIADYARARIMHP
jgi:hypothetical protein